MTKKERDSIVAKPLQNDSEKMQRHVPVTLELPTATIESPIQKWSNSTIVDSIGRFTPSRMTKKERDSIVAKPLQNDSLRLSELCFFNQFLKVRNGIPRRPKIQK